MVYAKKTINLFYESDGFHKRKNIFFFLFHKLLDKYIKKIDLFVFLTFFFINKQEVKLNLLQLWFVINFMIFLDFSWGIFEVKFYIFVPPFLFLSH